MSRMHRNWATHLLLFLLGSCVHTTPIEGAWLSNRELTLAEIRSARNLTPQQLQKLSDPGFFGHMVHVYRGNRMLTVFDGECSEPVSFEILDSDKRSVTIRYFDEQAGAERDLLLDVGDNKLYVPFSIADSDLREVFRQVPLEAISNRHPCIREFTGE